MATTDMTNPKKGEVIETPRCHAFPRYSETEGGIIKDPNGSLVFLDDVEPLERALISAEREKVAITKERECWIYNAKELQKAFNALEQEQIAIRTGLQKEFDSPIPPNEDVVDLIETLIVHHKKVEQQKKDLLSALEGMLDEIIFTRRGDGTSIMRDSRLLFCVYCGCNVSRCEEHNENCNVGMAEKLFDTITNSGFRPMPKAVHDTVQGDGHSKAPPSQS